MTYCTIPVSYTHLDVYKRQVQNMLDGLSTKGNTIIPSGKTSTGERWNNAIRLKGKGSYVKYAANGQYRLLSGVITIFPIPSIQMVGNRAIFLKIIFKIRIQQI